MTQEIRKETQAKSMKEIVELINVMIKSENLDHPEVGPKTFNNKTKAVDRYMDLLEESAKKAVENAPEPGTFTDKTKRGYKMNLIRETILKGFPVTRTSLARLVGSTERNVHIMISILTDPTRRKDSIEIKYDKKERTYTLNND